MFRDSSRRTLLLACILLTSIPLAAWAFDETSPIKLQLIEAEKDQPAAFEATGLNAGMLSQLAQLEANDPAFAKLFSITVADPDSDSKLPAISGKYRLEGERLLFVPRFPIQRGLSYRAVLDPSAVDGGAKTAPVTQEIVVPKWADETQRAATEVRQIYPSGDVLPENHLRFYIHFSQPMARTVAYQNLELLDEQGKVVEAAFLELGEELWDPTGRRFTLLLDPGRIKRGLVPREEEGPILVAGHKYTLVVKATWEDAFGHPLKSEHRKSFTTGSAQEKPLNASDWKLRVPPAGASGLLSVSFPFPLDHALLDRLLTVVDAAGEAVQGKHIVCDDERKWTFQPDEPWQPGHYKLVVDTVLEDSAGNRIGRAFEVDQAEDVEGKLVPQYVNIPFQVVLKDTAAKSP